MNSQLYFYKKNMRGTPVGKSSNYPSLRHNRGINVNFSIDEDDGIFGYYGMIDTVLPHKLQNGYGVEKKEMNFNCAVLENDFLKAEFLPELGGHLWSLVDKTSGRDLVYENKELILRNLAICDAWFAGGIEWNCGRRGHSAYTCSPVFCATTQDDDGTPVLRFYEFDRDRACTYQIEFWLPEKSKFLLVRVRIVNPNNRMVPMYWWSNIAFEEVPGGRIVTPADTSFAIGYFGEGKYVVTKVGLPMHEGYDCTYPCNHINARDHFFNIPRDERKFEAALYSDGFGLIQCSTDRLQGRKLFVWGQCPGGRNWQRRLLSDPEKNYIEIQAGLAKTQTECVPMPPNSVFEWVEAYGAIQVEPRKVFGDWKLAQTTVAEELQKLLPRETLDEILVRTRSGFATKPAKVVSHGSGWGALENYRRKAIGEKSLPEYLDFGEIGVEQREWLELLEKGTFSKRATDYIPPAFMVQDEWFNMLRKADRDNWYVLYHLGLNWYYREDYERAIECFRRALNFAQNAFLHHALAYSLWQQYGIENSVQEFKTAVLADVSDVFLVKDAFKALLEAERDDIVLDLTKFLPESVRNVPAIKMFQAFAFVKSGDWQDAEKILYDGSIRDIPDIREGEHSLSELYIAIQIVKGAREDEIVVPREFDLRMNTQAKK